MAASAVWLKGVPRQQKGRYCFCFAVCFVFGSLFSVFCCFVFCFFGVCCFCCFCVCLSFSFLCFDICLLFVGRDALNRQVSAFSHVTRCYAPLVPPEFPNTRRPRGIHTPALRSPKPPRRSLEEASAGSLFARTRWVSKVPVLRGGALILYRCSLLSSL